MLAGAPAPCNWKHELDVARIDFLLLGNTDRPLQAARIEPLAERRGQAVAGVGQHRCKTDARGSNAINLGLYRLRGFERLLRWLRGPVRAHEDRIGSQGWDGRKSPVEAGSPPVRLRALFTDERNAHIGPP